MRYASDGRFHHAVTQVFVDDAGLVRWIAVGNEEDVIQVIFIPGALRSLQMEEVNGVERAHGESDALWLGLSDEGDVKARRYAQRVEKADHAGLLFGRSSKQQTSAG